MADNYGYRTGRRVPRKMLLDSTSADIAVGDLITSTNATAGYVKEVDAVAEKVVGVSMTKRSSPSADGDAWILVDVSEESIYEYPPDAGSVTQSLANKTMDAGADARSIDINGSTTDDVLCVEVDVDANLLLVRFNTKSVTGV